MKFNERELAAWASAFVPDKEGILEKKGPGIGQGKIDYTDTIATTLITVKAYA